MGAVAPRRQGKVNLRVQTKREHGCGQTMSLAQSSA
jgi:hypothetical protein